MAEVILTIRRAVEADAPAIAIVHDEAWRGAYRGIIPGRELERMIARRGPAWWQRAIRRGAQIVVLDFADAIAGYVSYGQNRVTTLPQSGEIFELYVAPVFQGLGFGKRLFDAARLELADRGFRSIVVWALADNANAVSFYRRRGGSIVRTTQEHFGVASRERVAFGFDAK